MRVKTMGILQLVRKFLKVIKTFFVFENQSIQTDVVNTNRWGHFYCEDSRSRVPCPPNLSMQSNVTHTADAKDAKDIKDKREKTERTQPTWRLTLTASHLLTFFTLPSFERSRKVKLNHLQSLKSW